MILVKENKALCCFLFDSAMSGTVDFLVDLSNFNSRDQHIQQKIIQWLIQACSRF